MPEPTEDPKNLEEPAAPLLAESIRLFAEIQRREAAIAAIEARYRESYLANVEVAGNA